MPNPSAANLVAQSSTTNQAEYSPNAFTKTTGKACTVDVYSAVDTGTAGEPTLTSLPAGVTSSTIITTAVGLKRLTTFWVTDDGSSGTFDMTGWKITHGAGQTGCAWWVDEWTDAGSTVPSGGDAVAANGTDAAPVADLSAITSGNSAHGAMGMNSSTTVTAGSGFTLTGTRVNSSTPTISLAGEYRANSDDTTVDFALGASATWIMHAIEIPGVAADVTNVTPGAAPITFTANNATIKVNTSAGVAAVTATANNATTTAHVSAGVALIDMDALFDATGGGISLELEASAPIAFAVYAFDPEIDIVSAPPEAFPDTAVATFTANDASGGVSPTGAVASASFTANDATISTSKTVTGDPGAVTFVANDASVSTSLARTPTTATVTVTANDASGSTSLARTPTTASVTFSAQNASVSTSLAVAAGVALATLTASAQPATAGTVAAALVVISALNASVIAIRTHPVTTTFRDTGHTVTVKDRGHTTTARGGT